MPKPVILDVDPGVDDALAILLALRSEELEVRALTVVNGNVPLISGVENALKVVELAGRGDIPVYGGAERPLRRDAIHAKTFHGESGLGDARLPTPSISAHGDAVDFMKTALRSEPGVVTVVALGPLTNLALVEQRDPGILQCARQIVVMGGALHSPGNVAPHSEFNFFVDPDAARAVIRSGAALTLVPLDATRIVDLSREELQQQPKTNESPAARFCEDATRVGMAIAERMSGGAVFYLHDPLAVATTIDASICNYEEYWIDIETEGELTAGQVVFDRRMYANEADRTGRRIRCAVTADRQRMLRLFFDRALA
jgi:inosine-uridine nucleoside N-ribohydrolase